MLILCLNRHVMSYHNRCSVCEGDDLKGLVHPKMKIKSLITHPHAELAALVNPFKFLNV